jgi:hypothetical protein
VQLEKDGGPEPVQLYAVNPALEHIGFNQPI